MSGEEIRQKGFPSGQIKLLTWQTWLRTQLNMTFSFDHNQSLGYLTAVASRLLSNLLAVRLHTSGIEMTAEQWGAIIVLMNSGPMTQGQLGERLHLEKSSVSRLTNGLEKRGWIERTKGPKDSRQRIVTLTSKALETAERCSTIARTILEEAQHGMTEDERLVLRSLLSRTMKNLRGLT